jgi:chromosome partitioning protein
VSVIALVNRKGGSSKSTTTVNLGGVYARRGLRVLLVDSDSQASLTQGLIGPAAADALPARATIAAVYSGDVSDPAQVIAPTAFPGLDLLRGSEAAEAFNRGKPHEAPWELQTALADFLRGVRGRYDRVLIDCPPNLNLCCWAALAAADRAVIPVQPEDYGAQGLPAVRRSIELARRVRNPGLSVLGYAVTLYHPRRALHRIYVEELRRLYGPAVMDAMTPNLPEIPEATMKRMPVAYYKPRGAAAKAFGALADEVEARLADEVEAPAPAAAGGAA